MKRKLFILLLAVFLAAPAFGAGDLEMFNKRLAEAGNEQEKADIQKEIGDYHAGISAFDKAADAYIKALPHLRGRLSENDRLRIAIYMSWGGRLTESEMEIRSILQGNPENTRARIQLARVLLWSGNPDQALAEAETVLEKLPEERDALLVKADALRSRGETDRAIAIYGSLLEQSENFDIRIGLCHAYLKQGNVKEAQSCSALLQPAYPYQEQELAGLHGELEKAAAQGKRYTLKAEGDALAARQQFTDAAGKYEEVLALPPRFPTDEWLRMATVMSWGGRHKAAKRELEAILAQEPSHFHARLQLARVLTWMGEFDAAIQMTETLLASHPDDRDVFALLLVKANATRLRGFHRDADRLYSTLLSQAEDFDARLGLTYSYLAGGYRVKTDESLAQLKPRYPYEEKELDQLRAARDRAFRPRIYGGVTFYDDDDDNEVTTFSTGAQVWLGNWKTNLDYRHASADDPDRTEDSDALQLSTYSRMPWYGGLGGGIGIAGGSIMTWKALADFDVFYGSVGLLAAREAYAYTAELLDNEIRATILAVSIIQRPTDRIALRGSYSYRDFSDDNSSNDIQAGFSYLFFRKPAMAVGYRFRYLDYERQSRGGYFDPDNFLANSAFVNLSFETDRFYGYIEPYVGYQNYERYDDSHSEIFYGATGSLGYRVNKWLAVEGNAEWGNYGGSNLSSGSDDGWYYSQLGLQFIFTF